MNTAERDLLVTLARHALAPSWSTRQDLQAGIQAVLAGQQRGRDVDHTAPRLIQELLKSVPAPGQPFPFDDRVAWTIAANALFDAIYGALEGPVIVMDRGRLGVVRS